MTAARVAISRGCLTIETFRDIAQMRGVRDPSQEFVRYIAQKHAVHRRPLVLDAADWGGLSQCETPTVSE